jgi:CubicO group peptidase (beta-lactamase class C family)
VRTIKAVLVALAALAVIGPSARAQSNLPVSLFERYLEALRQQAGIPGLSAAIVQNGRVVWDSGFGYRDIEAFDRATADTPYPVFDLTQALSSTVVLQQCMEQRYLELTDRVTRWNPEFPDTSTTMAQLLSHTSPSGSFRYDPDRFAALTGVADQCASSRYVRLLVEEIFNRLSMTSSVPGADILDPASPHRRWINAAALERYAGIVRRQAVPYRVDGRGRPTRATSPAGTLSAATGVISTVRDLARFDAALDEGVLLEASTRSRAWEATGSAPAGLGWFVYRHNGDRGITERVVWHFGLARDAYSSLIVKVPARSLTLILLANSDGLAGPPYNLADGNLSSNLFASLFLKLFVG